jgi:hypothetical protein
MSDAPTPIADVVILRIQNLLAWLGCPARKLTMSTLNLDFFFLDRGANAPAVATIYVEACGWQNYNNQQFDNQQPMSEP